jgi:exodeoxyribonuclease III
MKLISWNVNGIRAILKKNFLSYVEQEAPDILCLQETKAHPEQVDAILHEYKHQFWNSAVKKGYSGTLVFTKKKPIEVNLGIGVKEHDTEGRVITLEFPKWFLVNVYTPNSGSELKRLEYRQGWDKAFRKYLKHLEKSKPVITCGDLNVAHEDIDLARPKDNHFSAGFTDEERDGIRALLKAGFVDSFREKNPDKKDCYSWWSYRTMARERNIGWRIDYFLYSEALKKSVKDAFIRDDVWGSDHCPVGIII